jgi:hypothetical protein
MDLNKEQILQILEFFKEMNTITPEVFEGLTGLKGMLNFHDIVSRDFKYFNLQKESEKYADFFFHLYGLNLDKIKNDTLTVDNLQIPQLKPYSFDLVQYVTLLEKQIYTFKKYDAYSQNTIRWDYYMGVFDHTDGVFEDEQIIDMDVTDSELKNFKVNNSNSVKESKEDKLKKLFKMREIIDNKIKDLI